MKKKTQNETEKGLFGKRTKGLKRPIRGNHQPNDNVNNFPSICLDTERKHSRQHHHHRHQLFFWGGFFFWASDILKKNLPIKKGVELGKK